MPGQSVLPEPGRIAMNLFDMRGGRNHSEQVVYYALDFTSDTNLAIQLHRYERRE